MLLDLSPNPYSLKGLEAALSFCDASRSLGLPYNVKGLEVAHSFVPSDTLPHVGDYRRHIVDALEHENAADGDEDEGGGIAGDDANER